VAVALGVALLGDRPGTGAVAGLLLILAGSWLSTDGRLPPRLAGPAAILTRKRGRAAGEPGRQPHQLLVGQRTVQLRGVQEVDARLERRLIVAIDSRSSVDP